jgi:hypothetical protein
VVVQTEIADLPYSRNHEQHQRRGGDHPSNVTGIVVDVQILRSRIASGAALGTLVFVST